MTHGSKIPDITLERLAVGELSPEEKANVLRQLESEPGGMTRLEQLHTSNTEILGEYPSHQMVTTIKHRYENQLAKSTGHSKWWIALPTAATAAAAAILLLMIYPSQQSTPSITTTTIMPPADDVRIKGEPDIILFKKSGISEMKIEKGEMVKEGDILQLKYQAGNARHMVIYSLDGNGAVTLHYPQTESASTAVIPGQKHVLPFGYQLDDAPEFERFFVIWSHTDTPIDVKKVLGAADHLKAPQQEQLTLPKGLEQKDFLIKKANQ